MSQKCRRRFDPYQDRGSHQDLCVYVEAILINVVPGVVWTSRSVKKHLYKMVGMMSGTLSLPHNRYSQ